MDPFGSERPWSLRDTLVGLSLMVVALGVRLPGMGEGYWIDEVISSDLVGLGWTEILARVGFADIHPPLYYALLKGWTGLWGDPDWVGRSLSLIFGVLSVGGLYLWIRQRHGFGAASLGALYLALSTFHTHYSVEVRSYALFVFIAVWLFAAYEYWLQRPGSKGRFCGFVVAEILLLWTHYYGVLIVCLMSLHFLWMKKERQGLTAWWGLGQLMALCAFAAWLPLLLVQALHLPTRFGAHLSDELPVDKIIEAFGPAPCHPWPWVGLGVGLGMLLLVMWTMKGKMQQANGLEQEPLPTPTWKSVFPPMLGLVLLPLLPLATMPLTDTTMEVLVEETQRAYLVEGAALLLLGLSVWGGGKWSGRGRGDLALFLCVCGPLLVFLVNLAQPMLFLRNLLFLLLPFSVLLGMSLAKLPNPLRVASVLLVALVALPSLWAGPDTFMPRQDFRAVAKLLVDEKVDKAFVFPAWDLPGVQRYLQRRPSHAELHGLQQVDEIRKAVRDDARLAVVLTRPSRDRLSPKAISESLQSGFSLVNEISLKGHRGGLKVYRFNRIVGSAVP